MANERPSLRLSPEDMAALDRLVRAMRLSRQDVMRALIRAADESPVHRLMHECGVNRNEAREYLRVRQ